ncbi:hypothetical protein [Microtetraspora sp. NBRC 16547]|uniref:hypothetical protein n=1 Tax=Microtetraspora sp. NBRC 16547 TaxID=3030993 RepID=UPI0024A4AD1C|nr:hypothetical protein [Microtetraspora sp. NBRC 16547]GLX00801.1 hypothetical protein Misp02_48870 [Microtetraspora sp. NBRC 16547]
MRVLILPTVVIVVAALVYVLVILIRGAVRPGGGAVEPPRWETHTAMEDGWTLVIIRQMTRGKDGPVELSRQTVRAIPDDDPHWDERYREAMLEARSRITTLELESP